MSGGATGVGELGEYYVRINSDGTLLAAYKRNTAVVASNVNAISGSMVLSVNTEYLITVVLSQTLSSCKLYIDAVLDAGASTFLGGLQVILVSKDNIKFAAYTTSSVVTFPSNVTMEDARAYQRGLSQDEITSIFNMRGTDGILFSLLYRYLFNEGAEGDISPSTAGIIKDEGSLGNHLSSSGGAIWAASNLAPIRRY